MAHGIRVCPLLGGIARVAQICNDTMLSAADGVAVVWHTGPPYDREGNCRIGMTWGLMGLRLEGFFPLKIISLRIHGVFTERGQKQRHELTPSCRSSELMTW